MPSQTKCSAFTSLAHYITPEWLESAYHITRKDGAAGIDEVTGKQYADNLEESLRSLHERLKSGTYKAPPVRRTHIPKGSVPLHRSCLRPPMVRLPLVGLLIPLHGLPKDASEHRERIIATER